MNQLSAKKTRVGVYGEVIVMLLCSFLDPQVELWGRSSAGLQSWRLASGRNL